MMQNWFCSIYHLLKQLDELYSVLRMGSRVSMSAKNLHYTQNAIFYIHKFALFLYCSCKNKQTFIVVFLFIKNCQFLPNENEQKLFFVQTLTVGAKLYLTPRVWV